MFCRVITNQQKSVGYAMMDHQYLGNLCSMKQFITRVVTNWWVLRCGPYFVQCCPTAFFVHERPFVCVWFKRAMSSLFGNECEASGAILFGIETS